MIRPTPTEHELSVELTGSVTLEEKASVVSEVVGRVVWVSPTFSNGGSFAADETFIRIDPTKFELHVEAATMAVREAEARVWAQKARGAEDARRFALENPGVEVSEWVRRLPKIAEAEAELERARAELRLAELRLEDTSISFPFDGRVMTSDVEVGELVGPVDLVGRTSLGVVYRPSALQVDVPIDQRELDSLGRVIGRTANVSGETGTWRARVARVSSVVAPRTRLASIFLKFSGAARPSSLPAPGEFVEVEIKGPTYRDVFMLPESARQESNGVWIVRAGTLRRFEPEEVRQTAEAWIVREFDVSEGLVVGRIPRAREGLAVTATD
ncbi:MAG: HlyD family efflux transporter periplasmic adaptor subunit [Bryobacterales bacterium]|nr:HlyD family efflux transporter periplasmic adaptor subunit [Bryobacterales bacterium]